MKFFALALVLAASFAGSVAHAGIDHDPVVPPPAKFAHGPYLVPPIYHQVDDVNAACQALAPQDRPYQACSILKTGDIFLPKNDKSDWWQELRAHEQAHLRGWGADHKR